LDDLTKKMRLAILLILLANGAALAGDPGIEKPQTATEYFESSRAHLGVWIDPARWKLNPHPHDLFSTEFKQVGGKSTGFLVADRATIPLEALAEQALEGFRSGSTDVRIVDQQTRVVTGREVLFLTFNGDFTDGAFDIYGYYYSGQEGTIRLAVSVPAGAGGAGKSAAIDFLSGIQIGAPDSTSVSTRAASPAPDSQLDISQINASVPFSVFTQTQLGEYQIRAGDEAGGAARLKAQAEKGDGSAMCFLALCYCDGEGVPKDRAEALRWMKKAAVNTPIAQACLGNWYLTGFLVPKDRDKAGALLKQAAAGGVPYAQAALGDMLAATNKKAAFEWYRKAALQGFAQAELDLAACYSNGIGVPRDNAQFMKWLLLASKHGNTQAQFLVAGYEWTGNNIPRNLEDAAALFKAVADSGSAIAQADYATCLWSGSGVAVDRDEALSWFRKAADQGEVSAENFLGRAYAAGDGVERDPDQAIYWYRKAAGQGSAPAQFEMGAAYFQGIGTPEDHAQGLDWFRKSAAGGDTQAAGVLAQIYEMGASGISPDPSLAMSWAQKAAAGGDAQGEYVLAVLYNRGQGAAVDREKAFSWYKKSAEQGNANAEFVMGISLLNGLGTARDPAEGVKWLRLAAEQDNPLAESELGLCYATGRGVSPDPVEAVRWFRFSAEQGCPRGEVSLGYALQTGAGVPQDLVEAYKWFILACMQEKDTDSENRAMVNMNNMLPMMTKEQMDDAKKRAHDFIPKRPHPTQPEDFSVGAG
jgi:TPR repeat protein